MVIIGNGYYYYYISIPNSLGVRVGYISHPPYDSSVVFKQLIKNSFPPNICDAIFIF